MDNLPLLGPASIPELREPIVVAAFGGWNDAANGATFAVETLLRLLGTDVVAQVDPEEFYDFTETRPIISLTDDDSHRSLTWPQNRFFAHRLPGAERDLVLFLGVEPQLKWRSYCRIFTELGGALGASCLVTLGALLAEVPHTIEPRVTGFATGAADIVDVTSLDLEPSSYEGPTGIIGTLHDAWLRTGKPAVSLWGNVPHYVSATPNPSISLALLRRLATVIGVEFPLEGLAARALAFRTQIDEALDENPEAREYVEQLEAGYGTDSPAHAGPELIDALEEYLRRSRPKDEE
jgi:proteasome assembly chaperone (PAC2) family protein